MVHLEHALIEVTLEARTWSTGAYTVHAVVCMLCHNLKLSFLGVCEECLWSVRGRNNGQVGPPTPIQIWQGIMGWEQSGSAECRVQSSHTVVLIRLVEAAELADRAHPAAHLLLGLGHQVEGALWCLDVEHKAVLEVLALEGEAGVHLLAEVQVDDSDGLLGALALVVLQHVGVAAHAAAAQDEPALLPGLRRDRPKTRSKGSLKPLYTKAFY